MDHKGIPDPNRAGHSAAGPGTVSRAACGHGMSGRNDGLTCTILRITVDTRDGPEQLPDPNPEGISVVMRNRPGIVPGP